MFKKINSNIQKKKVYLLIVLAFCNLIKNVSIKLFYPIYLLIITLNIIFLLYYFKKVI